MRKYLKMRLTAKHPETFIAFEYNSDSYLSWSHVSVIQNITWQSDPLGTDKLAGLLEARGWHQTDIGDELAEARSQAGERSNNSFKPKPLRGSA